MARIDTDKGRRESVKSVVNPGLRDGVDRVWCGRPPRQRWLAVQAGNESRKGSDEAKLGGPHRARDGIVRAFLRSGRAFDPRPPSTRHPGLASAFHTNPSPRPTPSWRADRTQQADSFRSAVFLFQLCFDLFPRNGGLRIPPVFIKPAVNFSFLRGCERRLVAVLRDAVPERLGQFNALEQRQGLCRGEQFRIHGRRLSCLEAKGKAASWRSVWRKPQSFWTMSDIATQLVRDSISPLQPLRRPSGTSPHPKTLKIFAGGLQPHCYLRTVHRRILPLIPLRP